MLSNDRVVVDEIMDGPDVDPSEHARALAGLGRINRISRAASQMALPIIQFARREKLDQISMLDVACGGGDVAVGIAVAAAAVGIRVNITLLDRSATALTLATAAAKSAGIVVNTMQADLLNDWKTGKFDVVTCSLFLHHVREPDHVVALLGRMRLIASRLVVISDLRRSKAGVVAAWIGSRLLSRSPIVHFDAPASVRAAWTRAELIDFAARAQMKSVRVDRCWPWRMMLVCEATEQNT